MKLIFYNFGVYWKEEDEYGSYSKMITKYYLAEGVQNGNYLLEATMNENPWDLVNTKYTNLITDLNHFCSSLVCRLQ